MEVVRDGTADCAMDADHPAGRDVKERSAGVAGADGAIALHEVRREADNAAQAHDQRALEVEATGMTERQRPVADPEPAGCCPASARP